MSLLTRKRHWGLATLTAVTCAVVAIGLSQSTSSAATKITLTEEDYFNTPGQTTALTAYNKQFEAARIDMYELRIRIKNLHAVGHRIQNDA